MYAQFNFARGKLRSTSAGLPAGASCADNHILKGFSSFGTSHVKVYLLVCQFDKLAFGAACGNASLLAAKVNL